MGMVNVVLPDGRVVSVDEERAKALNLPLEGAESAHGRESEHELQSHYSGAGQTFLAGLEGAASTLTLGISDAVLGGENSRARAHVHPVARGLGELAGAAVPFAGELGGALGTAGRVAADFTPAGLAVKAGAGLAEATGAAATSVRGLATAAGVEGALQGAGGEIARAKLSGDPLTVEAIVNAAGRGALLGAASGATAGVILRGVEKARVARDAAAAIEASKVASKNAKIALDEAEELFIPVKAEVKAMKEQLATQVNEKGFLDAIRRSSAEADDAMRNVGLRGATRGTSPDLAPDPQTQRAWQAAERDALKRMGDVERAVRAKDTTAALEAHKMHIDAVNRATELAGMPQNKIPVNMPDPATVKSVLTTMKSFPDSARAFAAMHPDTVADLVNTLRGVPNTQAVRALDSLSKMAEKMGLKVTEPVQTAADLAAHLRTTRSAVRSTEATADRPARRGLIDWVKQRIAMKAGAGVLGWTVGGPIGAVVAMEASGAKSWLSNRLQSLILKTGEPVAKGLRRLGPVTDRLRETMTGGYDKEPSMEKVVANRLSEIRAAGVSARDIGFGAASPFAADHPEFALQLANTLATGLEFMMQRAPKDPGSAMYMGQSQWHFSADQQHELAAVWEAIMHPVDALERMFQGDVDPSAAQALWATSPALMQEAQIHLIMNMAALQSAPYPTVIGLSTAFQVPLDSLLRPENVSFFQTLSSSALQTGGVSAPQGAPNPGGRPPAVGTSNTRSSSPTQQTRTQQLLGA